MAQAYKIAFTIFYPCSHIFVMTREKTGGKENFSVFSSAKLFLTRRYCYTDIMILIIKIAILTVLPGIF